MTSNPELCRQVAEACGFKLDARLGPPYWYDQDGKRWVIDDRPELCGLPSTPFRPDADWNHAMLAAKRFIETLGHRPFVLQLQLERSFGPIASYGSRELLHRLLAAGPRAICEAIIGLAPVAPPADPANV